MRRSRRRRSGAEALRQSSHPRIVNATAPSKRRLTSSTCVQDAMDDPPRARDQSPEAKKKGDRAHSGCPHEIVEKFSSKKEPTRTAQALAFPGILKLTAFLGLGHAKAVGYSHPSSLEISGSF